MKFSSAIKKRIYLALEEDIGSGDITSSLFFSKNEQGVFSLVAKQDGIICGLSLAEIIFYHLDNEIEVTPLVSDGQNISIGQELCRLTGNIQYILQGERTFLNLIQRLSGIATKTNQYVQVVKPYGVTILDTRKTVPLWRELDKYAVRIGGGQNHRMGLYDMILIKDNHIDAAGGITKTLKIVKKRAAQGIPVEIEVRSLNDFGKVLEFQEVVDFVMLDNMSPSDIIKAVEMAGHNIKLEASGSICIDNIEAYAQTGVQYISLGELTHSVKSLDLSLLCSGT